VELRDHPRLAAGLRVVGAFGPSTIQPVVAASRLPAQLKAAVREVLLGLGSDAAARSALARGFVERFVDVGDGDYDDIRAMLAAIHAAGQTTLR
jgi:ABC-type phosphate/phosphonate transport system substrate-binding protein